MPIRVLFADPIRETQRTWWRGLFPATLASGLVAGAPGDEAWRSLLPQAEALAGYRFSLTSADLDRAKALKLVVQVGVHPPAFDLALLAERGISFRVVRDPANVAVADHTLALILALHRGLLPTARLLADGQDRHPRPPAATGEESYAYDWAGLPVAGPLDGRSLGLVGLGEIGLEVVRRAKAFGMRVLYTRRRRLRPDLEFRLGVEYRSLDDLLGEADVVSLHAPHTAETEMLVGDRALARMRPGALLVNTSRGGLVDERALVRALDEGRLGGAALDVYQHEPLPHDSPLRGRRNVILTPHVAAVRPETVPGAFNALVETVSCVARGEEAPAGAESDLIYVM